MVLEDDSIAISGKNPLMRRIDVMKVSFRESAKPEDEVKVRTEFLESFVFESFHDLGLVELIIEISVFVFLYIFCVSFCTCCFPFALSLQTVS